jgi:hypothetical protein
MNPCPECGAPSSLLSRSRYVEQHECNECGYTFEHNQHGDGPTDLRSSEDVYPRSFASDNPVFAEPNARRGARRG